MTYDPIKLHKEQKDHMHRVKLMRALNNLGLIVESNKIEKFRKYFYDLIRDII